MKRLLIFIKTHQMINGLLMFIREKFEEVIIF